MADLSKGRGDGSVLAGQRLPLFWPWHSQGETKVTAPAVTDSANAEPITKAASRAGKRAPFTAASGSRALIPHQHRFWRRRTSAASLAPLLPASLGRAGIIYWFLTKAKFCPDQ